MKLDVIYTEDCQEGIPKRLPDGCIDLMPTDPPYGIAFMGREWDKFNEIVRPQGAYESVKGFKKLPRQSTASMKEFFVPRWRECLRVLKAGGFAFVMCSPRADVMAMQILCLQEAGFMVGFTPIFWAYASGFPKSQNIGKAVDKRLGANREIVGKNPCHREVGSKELYRKGATVPEYITKPASPQAQALDGSYAGMQLKPAVEVILVAMKPLSEKTYVDQALRNRKGITWLGNGRIPYKSSDKPSGGFGGMNSGIGKPGEHQEYRGCNEPNNQGRFPANLLCSDDALNDGTSGHSTGHYSYQLKKSPYDGGWKSLEDKGYLKESNNSFSRYFSLDAWFDKKLKELPEGEQGGEEQGMRRTLLGEGQLQLRLPPGRQGTVGMAGQGGGADTQRDREEGELEGEGQCPPHCQADKTHVLSHHPGEQGRRYNTGPLYRNRQDSHCGGDDAEALHWL